MVKELATLGGTVGASAAALAFGIIVVGFLGFRLVADRKGNGNISRDTRKSIQVASSWLIGLALLQFTFQVYIGVTG